MQYVLEADHFVAHNKVTTTPKVVKTWGVYLDIVWTVDGVEHVLRMTQAELEALRHVIRLNNQ